MGFITFAGGAFGLLILMLEHMARRGRVPLRYYAMVVALIAGGLSMIGIGQSLRPLLLLVGRDERRAHANTDPFVPRIGNLLTNTLMTTYLRASDYGDQECTLARWIKAVRRS
jgi:hypothetical protein